MRGNTWLVRACPMVVEGETITVVVVRDLRTSQPSPLILLYRLCGDLQPHIPLTKTSFMRRVWANNGRKLANVSDHSLLHKLKDLDLIGKRSAAITLASLHSITSALRGLGPELVGLADNLYNAVHSHGNAPVLGAAAQEGQVAAAAAADALATLAAAAAAEDELQQAEAAMPQQQGWTALRPRSAPAPPPAPARLLFYTINSPFKQSFGPMQVCLQPMYSWGAV